MAIDWSKRKLRLEELAEKANKDHAHINTFLNTLLNHYSTDVTSLLRILEEKKSKKDLINHYKKLINGLFHITWAINNKQAIEGDELIKLEKIAKIALNNETPNILICAICESYYSDIEMFSTILPDNISELKSEKDNLKQYYKILQQTLSRIFRLFQ